MTGYYNKAMHTIIQNGTLFRSTGFLLNTAKILQKLGVNSQILRTYFLLVADLRVAVRMTLHRIEKIKLQLKPSLRERGIG